MSYSLPEDNPILACPKCHSRQWVHHYKNMGNCVCKNHKVWYFAAEEDFIREGEKWDNYETANCI